MKYAVFSLFILLPVSLFAQKQQSSQDTATSRILHDLGQISLSTPKALSFQDAPKNHLSVPHLDSTYKSAVHTDTSQSAFPGREDEVSANYIKMLQDLGRFLKAKGFKWEKTTKSFNRIYFSADGRVDYYLYNFKGAIAETKEAEFKALLNEFIKTYRFPMHCKVKFAQCSPVTYTD